MKQILLQLSKRELDYTQFMEHYSPPENGPYYVNIRDSYEDAEDPMKEISLFLQWLQRTGIGEQCGRAGFTIRENACDAMFSSLYTKYLLAAKRLMSITQEQFIREHEKLENALIDLKLVVADPFGYWVALDQEEPVPFAWFLRKAEVGVPYYIGTVLCSYA